jgi:hypothetical protein
MREQIAEIILNHWALEIPISQYPTYVKCMADGCGWEGRFPGDISEHCADLIVAILPREPE